MHELKIVIQHAQKILTGRKKITDAYEWSQGRREIAVIQSNITLLVLYNQAYYVKKYG